jgi:hypothetical protein
VRARALGMTMSCVVALLAPAAPSAFAQSTPPPPPPPPNEPATGGVQYGTEPTPFQPTVPGTVAQIVGTVAYAPVDAPPAVQQAIWAANRIVGLPYKYGGGHIRTFVDTGYDCSGTVSFALFGGGLLRAPRDSSSFARWGAAGAGQWITVYTNPGHAYLQVAGIRLDTSAADDPSGVKGPRWRPLRKTSDGYRARHPVGL